MKRGERGRDEERGEGREKGEGKDTKTASQNWGNFYFRTLDAPEFKVITQLH